MQSAPNTRRKRQAIPRHAFATSECGAIAVEFGFLFPVVLTMLLGIIEASAAISAHLSVQAAARTGAHFGLVKPPIQGDVSAIASATRAALPPDWVATGASNPPQVNVSVSCECELTGPAVCGTPCAAGETSLSYLKVDVSKVYTPIVALRYFATDFQFKNSSQVRLK